MKRNSYNVYNEELAKGKSYMLLLACAGFLTIAVSVAIKHF